MPRGVKRSLKAGKEKVESNVREKDKSDLCQAGIKGQSKNISSKSPMSSPNVEKCEFEHFSPEKSSAGKDEQDRLNYKSDKGLDKVVATKENKEMSAIEMYNNKDDVDKLLSDSEDDFDKLRYNSKKEVTNVEIEETQKLVSVGETNFQISNSDSTRENEPKYSDKIRLISIVDKTNQSKSNVVKCQNLENMIGKLRGTKFCEKTKHKQRKSDQILKCSNCSLKTWFSKSLVRHSRLKHFSTIKNVEEFVCPAKSCHFSFSQRASLRSHIKKDHPHKFPVRTILFEDNTNDMGEYQADNFTARSPDDDIVAIEKAQEGCQNNAMGENQTEKTLPDTLMDPESIKISPSEKWENTPAPSEMMVNQEDCLIISSHLSRKRRNEGEGEEDCDVKKARLMEKESGWLTPDRGADNKSFQMKPLDVKIKKLSPLEVKHKRLSREAVASRAELELVLEAMHKDSDGHFWTKVYPGQDNQVVDPASSVLHDLIVEHAKNCSSCQNNLESDCIDLNKKDGSSILELKEKISFLEDKLERLQQKILSISKLDGGQESYHNLLAGVGKPQLLRKNEYSVKQGYRIIDLHVFRLALQAAQGCGHAGLMIAEANSPVAQEDLATHLALLCSTCGAQTIFSTSSFSTEDPPNYSVNKTLLPLLGPNAYYSLISEVQKSENSMLININMKAAKNRIQQRAKLIMSLDKKMYPGLQQTIGGDIELDDTATAEHHHLQQEEVQGNIGHEEDDDIVEIPCENRILERDDAIVPDQRDICESANEISDDTNIQEKDETTTSDKNMKDNDDVVLIKDTTNDDRDKEETNAEEGDIRIVSATSLSSTSDNDMMDNTIAESETISHISSVEEATGSANPVLNITKNNGGPGNTLKLRAFTDLKKSSLTGLTPVTGSHSWTRAEGPPPAKHVSHILSIPAASSVLPNTQVQGGTVTPVAPGTKIVSSNVVQCSTSKSKLPPGVYKFAKLDGTEAVLIVKEDKDLRKNPIIAPKEPSHNASLDSSYRTPLQIFSSEVSNAIKKKLPQLSYSEIQKIVIDRWTRMTDGEKQAYRDKAAKNARNVEEPQGISLPAPSAPKPLFDDPSLPEGWQRTLVKRTIGISAGRYDVFIYTPDGIKLRNPGELRTYLYERGITDINPDAIDFSLYGDKNKVAEQRPVSFPVRKPPASTSLGPAQVKSIKLTHSGTMAAGSTNSEVGRTISSGGQSNELGRIVHTAGKKMVKMKLAGPAGEIKEILVPAIDGPNGTLKVAIPRQYSLPQKSSEATQPVASKRGGGYRAILPRISQVETVRTEEREEKQGEESDDEVIIDDGDDEWRPGDD